VKSKRDEAHEVDADAACQRAWDRRIDVGPIIARELKRQSEKKKITNFQSRMLCAYANVHGRTLLRWAQGRSRPKQSKRIEQACIELGWSNLLDVPLEDPDTASNLDE
jgi:hypothetical protein